MRKILAFILLSFLMWSCVPETETTPKSQMVVYIVDYDTNDFQAGTVLEFNQLDIQYSSLEIDIIEDPIENENDGAVSLIYEPTGNKIFEGALSVNGNAQISFPSMIPATDFYVIGNTVAIDLASIQDIGESYPESNGPIFAALDQLGLTEIFINNDALIGRFLYKPIDSNTENWKWIILFFDQ